MRRAAKRAAYTEGDRPAVVVSQGRWEQAQRWELGVWRRRDSRIRRWLSAISSAVLRRPRVPQEDWNSWWFEHFDGYQLLPREISSCLEIGCGPYTNLRLLMNGRAIERLVGSDPLASEYLRLGGTWLAQAHRRGLIRVDSTPGERLIGSGAFRPAEFAVVVMVNVLDHVQDAEAVLANAMALVAPHGYLVIGQDLSDSSDLEVSQSDIGHPIKIESGWIETRVLDEFDPLLLRELPRSAGRNPAAHCGTLLLIGQRRS